MIASLFALLVGFSPQPPPKAATVPFVVSILNESEGDDVVLRFVLSGPPESYSATREGKEILVRIAAQTLTGLSVPAPREPITALALGAEPGFSLRLTLAEDLEHEIVREMSSLRLVLKHPAPAKAAMAPAAIAAPSPSPSPGASPEPVERVDAAAMDTADLYRRLFPTTGEPSTAGMGTNETEIGKKENWYSNFTWLGIQARPWVSVSYVDGKTVQPLTNTVSADSYWVIQPNLGLGFSPRLGGRDAGEGQWKINYTPRFRRLVDLNLPKLTSHFFDFGLDQPIASLGSVYGTYHHAKGTLETDEIDAGREYGIGLNRVVDTPLQQFRRTTFDLGARFDFVADTTLDVNASNTMVRYGDAPGAKPAGGAERGFFDYDARTLNASLRRGLGESRFLSVLFGVHDTPSQRERKQIEGRGYSYTASLEGQIVAATTGKLLFGYRTQKNPKAGSGGQDYKDITYGAQLVREISEDTTVGLGADRKLYLSAYAENGFYVADSLKGDFNTRLPLGVFLRGSAGLQTNDYKASPQTNDGRTLVLRNDKIKYWSAGLARTLSAWAFVRADYISERRDSNLDRFDIRTRAFTFQLGLGYFGKPGGRVQTSW